MASFGPGAFMVIRSLFIIFLIFTSLSNLGASTKQEFSLQKIIAQNLAIKQKKYLREHQAYARWSKTKKGRMPRVSKPLLQVYYNLGKAYAGTYALHASGKERENEYKKYKAARYYLNAAAAYEFKIDEVEQTLDKLELMRRSRERLVSRFKFRLLMQYMSYQELASFTFAGGTENIYSPQRGLCTGVQWAYGNLKREWTLDTCFYYTSGNVGSSNTALYFQQNVPTVGALIKPTYWFQLSDDLAAFGLGVPVLIRRVNFTIPENSQVKSRNAVPVGASIDGRWKFHQRFSLLSSFALMGDSLLWSLGGTYNF
jgi:hypothetical protein